jgi:energy-coupling factor transporter ATP-binding protein EcfA2
MVNPYDPLPPDSPAAPAGDRIDLDWSLRFLERHGRQRYGPSFRIHESDHAVIYTLLVYFRRHADEAASLNIDLDRGILLTGPVGCGKTRLLELMNLVAPPHRRVTMKPCREVSFEFIEEGYGVIGRYSRMSYTDKGLPRTYCFDDLGTEQALKYYGNECNVLGEILLSRYDHFFRSGMVTHITTNLAASDIEAMYGNRVRSRMREVFNLVSFAGATRDKRV